MFGGLFGHGFPHGGGSFTAHYRAMPVAFIDKQQAEFGDKVILPPSALDRLGGWRAAWPLRSSAPWLPPR
jgi:ubiquitin fusion degradation protein 1